MELQSNPNSAVDYLYYVSSSDNVNLRFNDIYSLDEFYFHLAFPYFCVFFFLLLSFIFHFSFFPYSIKVT